MRFYKEPSLGPSSLRSLFWDLFWQVWSSKSYIFSNFYMKGALGKVPYKKACSLEEEFLIKNKMFLKF